MMRAHITAVVLVLVGAGNVLSAPASVCFIAAGVRPGALPECHATGRTFTLAASDQARHFVWSDERHAELIFGTVPPGATSIDIDALPLRKVLLSVAPAEGELSLTVDVTGASAGVGPWVWTLHDPAAVRSLQIARDATVITFHAPRHRPSRFSIAADAGERVGIGRVVLERLDTLTGRVVDGDNGAPVHGAIVESTDGAVVAETDADGSFEIDITPRLTEQWPTALHVKRSGYGTKVLPLAPAPQPRRWDRVVLTRGGSIHVRLSEAAPDDSAEDIVLELRRHRGGAPNAWETVKRAVTTPGAVAVVFDDLDVGKYVLTAAGSGPLEQLATDVEVEAGQTTERTVKISPVNLRVIVERSGNRVSDAKIDINHKSRWSASVVAPDGVIETKLWQRGDFTAFVAVPNAGLYPTRKTVEGDGDVEWRVEIPDRTVQGTVRERAGKPVVDAVIVLDRENGKQLARTDRAGRYRFEFLKPGALTVRVLPTDRFLAAATEIALTENDSVRNVDFNLTEAILAKVRLMTSSGQPAAKAKVYDATQPDVDLESDDAGELIVRLAKGETRRLIAVPWQGAFAILNVTAPGDDRPIVVQFQDGPAKLSITAKDEEDQPIAGVWFQLRFNGQPLPADVLQWIAMRDGNQLATGPDGVIMLSSMPLGVYELWPVTSSRQPAAPSSRAPVRFTAQPGENPVRLTFARW